MIRGRDWPYFEDRELASPDLGYAVMYEPFMRRLVTLREMMGIPLIVTSGYRSRVHHEEIYRKLGKPAPEHSAHLYGCAADIAVQGEHAYHLGRIAFALGFTGIWPKQHGGGRFVHLDYITGAEVSQALRDSRPRLGSYG